MSSCHASCYHCFSFVIFPELRPTILQNEPMADKLLKLLLPPLKIDFRDLSGFIGLDSTSVSLTLLILATSNWRMDPRKNESICGAADKGSSRAAHALCLCFRATSLHHVVLFDSTGWVAFFVLFSLTLSFFSFIFLICLMIINSVPHI